MKRKIIYLSLTLAFVLGFVFRVDKKISLYIQTRNLIIWSDNSELKFSDFKLDTNQKSQIKYSHGFGVNYITVPFFKVESFAYFEPEFSSFKDTTSDRSIQELKFQQIIFDLNEIFSRKIESDLINA